MSIPRDDIRMERVHQEYQAMLQEYQAMLQEYQPMLVKFTNYWLYL
jgi:hypothetical protein